MLSIEELLDTVDTSGFFQFNKTNFLIYCKFMIFDNDGTTTPPDVICEDYYRTLFKHIEMLYEDQIISEEICRCRPSYSA